MSTENPKRIVLIGDGRVEEALAAGTITPGMLIAQNSDGAYIAHGSSGGRAEKLFATEDALQGKTIADNYTSGQLVQAVLAEPGDVIYAFLAAGQSVTPATFLMSNGAGALTAVTSTNTAVAVSMETLDNSESGDSGVARIKVRVL